MQAMKNIVFPQAVNDSYYYKNKFLKVNNKKCVNLNQ